MLTLERTGKLSGGPSALEVLGWWSLWLAVCAGTFTGLMMVELPSRSLLAFVVPNAVAWLLAGVFLSRRVLRRLEYHHMMTLEDLARLKFRSLFFWPFIYLRLAFTLWIAKVL